MIRTILMLAASLLTIGAVAAFAAPKVSKPTPPTKEEIAKYATAKATITTKFGTIVVKFFPDLAPLHVKNFISLAEAGFYNGTVIHRVVADFVIQGGGYAGPVDASTDPAATKPVNAPIPLEANVGLSNAQWTIAMARTNVADSATSQFFINLADNSAILDASPMQAGYAVFGIVSAGTDTVSNTAAAPCASTAVSGAGDCTPIPNVVITSAVQTR